MGYAARMKQRQRQYQPPAGRQIAKIATQSALRAVLRPTTEVPIDGTDMVIICRPPDISQLYSTGLMKPETIAMAQELQMTPAVLTLWNHWCCAAAVNPRVVFEETDAVEGASIWVGDLPFHTRMAMVSLGLAGSNKQGSLAPYVPSPPEVVSEMLDIAQVKAGDVVYDLGCGDGRIVIAAAKRGARAVGVDWDHARIAEARAQAKAAGVSRRVKFLQQDASTTDVSGATVVTLYLLTESNLRLRDRLRGQLQPGARVVSHDFSMGDEWPASVRNTLNVGSRSHIVYLWTLPEKTRA